MPTQAHEQNLEIILAVIEAPRDEDGFTTVREEHIHAMRAVLVAAAADVAEDDPAVMVRVLLP